MSRETYFTPAIFGFLKDLAANNDRDWFQANKARYEQHVRDPAQRFISDFAPQLARVSRRFRADPNPVGGSLFRIYRDTRFSKDKSPYKTYTGIQFRHELGKDAHAPMFYLHLQPGEIFVGVGSWHPERETLGKIRDAIAQDPKAWSRVIRAEEFRGRFQLAGDSLRRPPKGYEPDHPFVDDLKRKDFVGVCKLTQRTVTSASFLEDFAGICRAGSPLVRFLCKATDVAY